MVPSATSWSQLHRERERERGRELERESWDRDTTPMSSYAHARTLRATRACEGSCSVYNSPAVLDFNLEMAVQRNRIISTRRLIGQQQAAGSGPYGPGDYLMSRLSAGTLSVDDLGSFDNEDDQIASLENTQFLQTTGLTPTRQPATINTFNYTPPSHLTSVSSHSSESQRHRNTSHTTFATSYQVTELVSMVQEQ